MHNAHVVKLPSLSLLKHSVCTAPLLTPPAAGHGQGGAGSTEGIGLLMAAARYSTTY